MEDNDNFPDGVKVKSLYKAIKLLDYFDAQHPERGISELAELSGMLKSSVYNIMSTYEECGIIEKNPRNSQYRLGLRILALSNVISRGDVFDQIISPHMDEICEITGETVFFATPYGNKIIYRDASYPNLSLSSRTIKGLVAPMYCTGLGKAMLAFMGREAIERVIAEGFEQYTPYTITDPQLLREELEKIRNQGFAVDNMEHEYGIKCVAVPLRNSGEEVVGAISVSGPSLRISDQKIQEYSNLVIERARLIKNRM